VFKVTLQLVETSCLQSGETIGRPKVKETHWLPYSR